MKKKLSLALVASLMLVSLQPCRAEINNPIFSNPATQFNEVNPGGAGGKVAGAADPLQVERAGSPLTTPVLSSSSTVVKLGPEATMQAPSGQRGMTHPRG